MCKELLRVRVRVHMRRHALRECATSRQYDASRSKLRSCSSSSSNPPPRKGLKPACTGGRQRLSRPPALWGANRHCTAPWRAKDGGHPCGLAAAAEGLGTATGNPRRKSESNTACAEYPPILGRYAESMRDLAGSLLPALNPAGINFGRMSTNSRPLDLCTLSAVCIHTPVTQRLTNFRS